MVYFLSTERYKLEKQGEEKDAGISDLLNTLAKTIGGDPKATFIDGTYEIEDDYFTLTCTINDIVFEIRSIDIRDNLGLGHTIIDTIHEYADENDLAVIASNVRDTAHGFWEKMDYQAGEEEDEYFRAM